LIFTLKFLNQVVKFILQFFGRDRNQKRQGVVCRTVGGDAGETVARSRPSLKIKTNCI
jgi:hypothetical protein